jgi:hypothetical protein
MNTRHSIWISVTVLIGLLFMISTGCKKNFGDKTPPSEVINLTAVPSNGSVTLSWTDPADEDYEKVIINYLSFHLEVGKGLESLTINGLTNSTEYTFLIKTVDASGNESEGTEIKSTPVMPPTLNWSSGKTFYYGSLTGPFTISRDFSVTGNSGEIAFNVQVVHVSSGTVLSETTQTFPVTSGQSYTFAMNGNGGVSISTCNACYGTPTDIMYKIRVISLSDGVSWETNLGLCRNNSSCSFSPTDKCLWNSASIESVVLQ